MKNLNKNLINFLKDYNLDLQVKHEDKATLNIKFYTNSNMVTNADYYLDTDKLSIDSAYEDDLFFYPNDIESFDYAYIAYQIFKQNPHLIDKLKGQNITYLYLASLL